jgi:RHS repeat-associated protein
MDELAQYSPHGRLTHMDATDTVVCDERETGDVCPYPSGLPFGFANAYRSGETGLIYMRNRWYSPRLAQFVSKDPLGELLNAAVIQKQVLDEFAIDRNLKFGHRFSPCISFFSSSSEA